MEDVGAQKDEQIGTSVRPMGLFPAGVMVGLIVLAAACATAPSTREESPLPAGDDCAVLTEVVDGFEVTIVGPKRPRLAQAPSFRFAAYQNQIGSIIASSPRLRETALTLMQDRSLGEFIQQVAGDPDVSYYLWEAELRRSGGGRTTHCNPKRFDIYTDLEYHLSTEGAACTNPRGSGSLQSLLAHELGHAWAWRWYGLDDRCDNNALSNRISVAWENTQLKNGAQRLLHNPPGCGCANIK